MEPDIIRMYSSSPPPLDNGAEEDDDDEFGEFGGFSEVSPSSVGFVDFDTPDYTCPKEEFVSSNHFMPIHDFSENVASLTSFKSIKNGNDKDITAELSTPVEEQSVLLSNTSKEIISSITSDTSTDGIENPGDLNKVMEQRQNVETPENFSLGDFRTDMNIVHQNKQLESCNGEKPPCLEILTNGFAGLETVNPQGTDDLDNVADSKGRKPLSLSTYSTEHNLDSAPSPAEEFADFATFSKKERIQLEEIGRAVLKDRDVLTIQENNKINRVNELNSVKEVSLDRSFGDKGDTDGEHQLFGSEISEMTDRDFSVEKQSLPTLQQDEFLNSSIQSEAWSLVDSADNSEAIRREQCKTEEKLDKFTSKCADLCMDSIKTSNADEVGSSKEESRKFTNSQSPYIDPTEENVLDDSVSIKNGDSSNDFMTCNDTNEDEFGDFGTASGTTPPFVTGTQDSMSDVTFEESSEHFPHFSEPGDDFGEFEDTNAISCQEEMIFTQSDLKQISDGLSEECQLARKCSGTGTEPVSKLKNEQDGEFGDFDSVPNTEDNCSAFQDSDDFADFSSAGPSQIVDWNAFEDEQKDGCSWAAFGDQQATESHHRKEVWQSHRTDENIDTLGTPKIHSVPLATSKGAVACGHLQESANSVQTALINRLERIFEACFPSISVPDAEEEVTSLKHLLETSTLPIKTREALAENGELLDVWTELQDIHDARGLRYQWGGSHSNKKLLCSLGIDTRNILFTGNKKQPVIVPMYAAGLGMLEPTKEPLKPLSAAEKIASIGQTTTMTPEINTCTSDQFQESLPPVQFDWSSSGLTNPLDGVDPELYELTTSKLEMSTPSLKVTDAFARLMSTVEKTSTSTRKPKREEHLSEEAVQVIASLPDLTFMHAKVLMFPATLMPSTGSREQAD
ncbi:aftiphilin isoform X2 [Castor canadensis]|jgi:hypothetical protein|uniref:Aftiphilin n=1 Tax=Castor canadensis TaxID=51338 RepID=A0A250Y5U4_CASCN|nr:aftiphilin isoform X2 [Castor canadensis]